MLDEGGGDVWLLECGQHERLLAKYWPLIRDICVLGLRGSVDAEDVAQDILLRLWRELSAGKRYPVEYEIVVRNVTRWSIRQHLAGVAPSAQLPEGWDIDPAPDASVHVDALDWVQRTLAQVNGELTRTVLQLRYLEALEVAEIARRLFMTPNAVHQRLHHGHDQLRGLLGHD